MKIHSKLASRAEGVAFLCKNWDAKNNRPSRDTKLARPFLVAILKTDAGGRPVTCEACLKILKTKPK
jgi:hypothetical protein